MRALYYLLQVEYGGIMTVNNTWKEPTFSSRCKFKLADEKKHSWRILGCAEDFLEINHVFHAGGRTVSFLPDPS